MEKKREDDEFAQLINEQFIREAEIMKEALFSDDKDTEDYEASDEDIKASYQKLMQRLRTEGACRKDAEDANIAEIGRKSHAGTGCGNERTESTVVPMRKKRLNTHKAVKAAGIIVVSGMCMFAAGMTCKANRDDFEKNVQYLLGNDTGTGYNDKDGAEEVGAEAEIINNRK